jgi:hypothetical protein
MYAAIVREANGMQLLGSATAKTINVVQTDKTKMNGLPPGLDIPANCSFYMSPGFW